MPELRGASCPKCGGDATREETHVGIMLKCTQCGFECGDPLKLDFKSD